jgi:FkbM family methyltransferase
MLKRIPLKSQIIATGALLPPLLKTRAMLRLLSVIAEFCPKEMVIGTNLGISTSYNLSFSNGDDSLLLFGRPAHYLGERGALLLARELTKRSRAFIDIGSHKGYYVFYVQDQNPKKPIFFFEPHPQLFEHLDQNIKRNGLEQITGFRMAVGEKSGQTQFYIDLGSTLQGSLKELTKPDHQVASVNVQITTFDDFVNTQQLMDVCVKVDIENAEFDFLNGARQSMNCISYLVMEVLGQAIKAGFVKTMIKEFGFHAYYINDFHLEYSPDGSFTYTPPQYNWLFCRLSLASLKQQLEGTPFTIIQK